MLTVENHLWAGPLGHRLWGGFHFGAMCEMDPKWACRGRDVPRGTGAALEVEADSQALACSTWNKLRE